MNVNVSGGELSDLKMADNANVYLENANIGNMVVNGKFVFS